MFRTQPDTEPAHVVQLELMPLSVLRLELPDLDTASLAGRDDVAIVLDDIGRAAISRDAARMLIAERAEHEERKRQMLAAADLAAEQYDRAWRASLGVGVPASSLPPGLTYAEAALSAQLDGVGYQPRASVLADAFDAPDSLVFHPLTGEVDEL